MSSDTPAQRAGRRALTASHRRALAAANPERTRVRGRHTADMSGASSSQTGPSQVMDPSQFQGMAAQFIRLEHDEYVHPHVDEEIGVEAEAEAEEHPGFPGGPSNGELLPNFERHRAYKVWTDPNFRIDVVDAIGTGKKLSDDKFPRPEVAEGTNWFWGPVNASGLVALLSTSYVEINKSIVTALVERWHPETSSFHLPVGEMTVTLDDVYCLLHVPIQGRLLDFDGSVDTKVGAQLMHDLLGMPAEEATTEAKRNKGAFIRYEKLIEVYIRHYTATTQLLEDGDDIHQVLVYHQTCCIRAFLLYLVGITLFANKSKKHIDVIFLEGMMNIHTIREYAWGAMGLATLYKFLSEAAVMGTRSGSMAGYTSLLVVILLL